MPATRAAMSFAGAVGFAEETTYGTAASITDWVAVDSATPSVKKAQSPWSLVTNDWMTVASTAGLLEVGVSLSFQVYSSSSISSLLAAGTYRVPFGAGSGTIAQPKSYTIELVMDNGSSIRLVGAVCNSLSLSVKPGEVVKATMEFQAKTATKETSGTPSVATGAMFHGSGTAVTFGGLGNTLCNSFDLNVSNNCSRRYTFTGSNTARRVRAGNQLVKGNFQFDFEETTQFDAFLAGTDQDVTLTVTAADSTTLVIDLPVVRYEGDDPALNGANIVEDKIPFLAVKDGGSGYAASIAVNADTTAPTLTVVPANGASGVGVTDNIVWTASEDLASGTVNSYTVFVYKTADLSAVPATVTLVNNGASTTITLNPTSSLAASTGYTAVVTTAVTDDSGNHLAANKISTFTTA